MASCLIDSVSRHVQTSYSVDGVEIIGRGPRSLNVQFPIEFHDFGAFCADMENTFNARMDMQASAIAGIGPTIVIYPPHEPGAQVGTAAAAAADPGESDEYDQDTEGPPGDGHDGEAEAPPEPQATQTKKPGRMRGGVCAGIAIPLAVSVLTSVIVFGARAAVSHLEL